MRNYDCSYDEYESQFLTKEQLDALVSLQQRLLENGFANLRPGGHLLYSTCSGDIISLKVL